MTVYETKLAANCPRSILSTEDRLLALEGSLQALHEKHQQVIGEIDGAHEEIASLARRIGALEALK